MNKAYSRIAWENTPSTKSPLNETNMNKMDLAIDTIDDRVISLDTTKANQSDLLTAVQSVVLNSTTGVITITQMDGTIVTYDTALEKIAINFDYEDDPTSTHYQQLIITLEDGSIKYVDLSALITQYEFQDTDTIQPSVSGGNVSFNIKQGSITGEMLKSSYLVQIRQAQAAAETAAEDSYDYSQNSLADALLSESHNHGNTGARDNEDTDNSKYYSERSNAWAEGKINGIDVPNTDPAYENNSKYWAQHSKQDAEAWAVGTRDGQQVPTTDPAYHNNAKYWADQAQAIVGIDVMQGATATTDGRSGLVPQPLAGDQDKVLFGDGSFREVKSSALLIDAGYVAIDYSILG